ncbi:MAG TPA: FKBP-type peptidyl-prolyl cis-trans isomerase [Solirubrobacteraceae bacterium]|nr:FKBP-type peptidyl-prolyl cis-trans isomerase [Solirubrobacteraceae bacterium]
MTKTNPALKAGATALVALALGAGVAACGSSKAAGIALAPGAGQTADSVTATTPSSTATTSTSTSTIPNTTPTSGPLSKEPTIARPSGPAPKTLVTKDLIVGNGATAKAGDQLAVNYVGELYTTGKIFDASWRDTPGKAFEFQLGRGAVIKGWDQGLVGMKVGGRRELIIPPNLAYGASGTNGIPGNSTLIFVVDLIGVGKG